MASELTVQRAAEVLIEHTRIGAESCRCGWGVSTGSLGESHAHHQIEALADAGLLATPAPAGDEAELRKQIQRAMSHWDPDHGALIDAVMTVVHPLLNERNELREDLERQFADLQVAQWRDRAERAEAAIQRAREALLRGGPTASIRLRAAVDVFDAAGETGDA